MGGVRRRFQLTPDSEGPAESNIYLPDLKALCMAENANATMHNILTPRGALVRDAKQWADYLTQSIRLYGDKSDVMRSEEHTSELQSLMRISYAVFCLKKKILILQGI